MEYRHLVFKIKMLVKIIVTYFFCCCCFVYFTCRTVNAINVTFLLGASKKENIATSCNYYSFISRKNVVLSA